MRAIYPIHFILLDSIILIVFAEGCVSWRLPLCNFIKPPVISFLFGPNILLSTRFQIPSACSLPLMSETKFHTLTNIEENTVMCTGDSRRGLDWELDLSTAHRSYYKYYTTAISTLYSSLLQTN
jgi:hypothetical protein